MAGLGQISWECTLAMIMAEGGPLPAYARAWHYKLKRGDLPDNVANQLAFVVPYGRALMFSCCGYI